MTDEKKPASGFLAAGLSQALPSAPPPPPPNLKHGRGRDDDVEDADAQEGEKAKGQKSDNAKKPRANLQKSKNEKKEVAMVQKSSFAPVQEKQDADMQESEITDEQLRYLAGLLKRVTAKEENKKKQKEDIAELLVQALATTSFERYRKVAEKQKSKVNQGLLAPEALFTIYKDCAQKLTVNNPDGPKTTVTDLMAKALIKYLVEDILPALERD